MTHYYTFEAWQKAYTKDAPLTTSAERYLAKTAWHDAMLATREVFQDHLRDLEEMFAAVVKQRDEYKRLYEVLKEEKEGE